MIVAPTLFVLSPIQARTGRLVTVTRSWELDHAGPARYVQVQQLCVASHQLTTYPVVRSLPTELHTLGIDVYLLAPVCGATPDAPIAHTFIARRYSGELPLPGSDAERQQRITAFVNGAVRQFLQEDPAGYRYLESLPASPERRRFERALTRPGSPAPAEAWLLEPRFTALAQRPGLAWWPTLLAFGAGALAWLLLAAFAPTRTARAIDGDPRSQDASLWPLQSVWALFRPTRHDYGLALLLDINVGVYLAMAAMGVSLFQADSADLLAWGANYGPLLQGLGWVRLLTSQFVHGGLVHLAGNLYGLVFAAAFLAPVLTNARFIAAYGLTGLGGALVSTLVHPGTLSVGASGAVFGLFGLLITRLVVNDPRVAEGRRFILLNVGLFVGFNLLLGQVVPGLDNAAHVGGLVTGLLAGLVIRPRPAGVSLPPPG